MYKCLFCEQIANYDHRGYKLCMNCHMEDDDVIDGRIIDHLKEKCNEMEDERWSLEDIITARNKQLSVAKERFAKYQRQARPLYKKFFDILYANRDEWYVKALVLTLPWIPLAFAVHWMW